MSRTVVLDTETTGLDPSSGHRIIEIGCLEIIDRQLTGVNYHKYINPMRKVDQGAINVHGLTNEFLQDKPTFATVADDFLSFIRGADLVIHNAPFDIGFMDTEFSRLALKVGPTRSFCTVTDTLSMARKKHPGQRNSLDALCKRYEVDNSNREFHGALLDAELLAKVYLLMTGGQGSLWQQQDGASKGSGSDKKTSHADFAQVEIASLQASNKESQAHEDYLKKMQETSEVNPIWQQGSKEKHD